MENSITIKQLHKLFLEMMEEFHSYCEQNNIDYVMVGGTLLGAARDKGFILWDDDVDFAMPRPDYERFLNIYNGKLKIEHYSKNKAYFFPYMKLFHENTPIVRVDDELYDVHEHVFLKFDIYPIDGVGCNRKKAERLASIIQKLRRIVYLNISEDKSSNLLKQVFIGCVRLIPSIWLIQLQDKLMSKYNYRESCFVTRWRMPDLKKNIVDKATFEPACLLPFEHFRLYAPSKYDAYLISVYGDYMKPKRENGGLRHGSTTNSVASKFSEYLKK